MPHPTRKKREKVLTERFDVRCSPAEKELIYQHAQRLELPVTRLVVLATLEMIERWENNNDESA